MNNANVVEFYDGFATRLLSDFALGNRRAESAIRFACDQLEQFRRGAILDLGFGIGWSSVEFAMALPDAGVLGVDLSPRLAELATRMFGDRGNLDFKCQDLTDEAWSESCAGRYDACVMLDVYEHVPRTARGGFHQALATILSDDAILILACPTTLHQQFLRDCKPEGLQPVDEDVTFDDLTALAKDLGGTVTHLEHKSLWATHDYFHATISRQLTRQKIGNPPSRHRLMSAHERMRRVRLATSVVGEGGVESVLSQRPSRVRDALKRLLGK